MANLDLTFSEIQLLKKYLQKAAISPSIEGHKLYEIYEKLNQLEKQKESYYWAICDY